MKTWLNTNKVFFTGLAGALLLVAQQFLDAGPIQWPVMLFALLMAGLGYVANQFKTKGLTLLGLIGTMAYVFVTEYKGGKIEWEKMATLFAIAVVKAYLHASDSNGSPTQPAPADAAPAA